MNLHTKNHRPAVAAALLGLVMMICFPGLSRSSCCCEDDSVAMRSPALELSKKPACCSKESDKQAQVRIDASALDNDQFAVPIHDCKCSVSNTTDFLLLPQVVSERSDSKPQLSIESDCLGCDSSQRLLVVSSATDAPPHSLDAQDRCARLCRWLK